MKSPKEVAENYLLIGEKKVNNGAIKTLLLGIMAGMFIALAGVGSTFGNVYGNKVVGAMIFPGGLAMVLIAGSELFTGNCLLVMPLLEKKVKLTGVLKNLGLVYLGNFIGALLIAVIAVFSGSMDGIASTVITTANTKCSFQFYQSFLKGIACNVLVCIAVWMSFSADTVVGKIVAVFFPIALFVIAGFEHSVANMYYLPAGLFEKIRFRSVQEHLSLINALLNNLLPVTLGNIVGGAFVGIVYRKVYLK